MDRNIQSLFNNLKFFKWFNNSYCLEGLTLLKRKEKSVYRPGDLWPQEDDEIFLRYCHSKRDRCYHMMARDSSCRPFELLKLKLNDVVFKVVNGSHEC
jgi:hypothetical protein